MEFLIVALVFSLFAEGQEIRGRIFHGQEAESGQFKYTAVVYTRKSYASMQGNICGGAIIASNWVLTAAHCLYEKVEAAIFLGTLDRDDAEIMYTVEKKHFFLHPEYKPKRNDIALITIQATIECENIAYARMPYSATNPQAGQKAIIMGWGHMGDHGALPMRLQWAEVKVISNEECRRDFPVIIDSDVCVSTEAPLGSPCSGDSGGPLVLPDTGELIGVVSTGDLSSCETGKPGVFVRVSSYMSWITKTTGINFY